MRSDETPVQLDPHERHVTRSRRWWTLLAVTLAGLGVGVVADLAATDEPISFGDAMNGILFAPFTAVCAGGVAADSRAVGRLFLVGGLLFWPVYALLARRWLQRGTPWLRWVLFLWCCQGFFRLVTRFWAVMSV